ncbi:MAG: ferredoxin--NADP reductase [Bacteriovoracia bacterium]
MRARDYTCTILEVLWVTPSVLKVRFEPHKKFKYEPGQFLSIAIPSPSGKGKPTRRAYSFALPFEVAKERGYELCVKYVPGGIGTGFLKSLRPGDRITVSAPYGDFVYKTPEEGRSVCFISTGTGIAPFRSVVMSNHFKENFPEQAFCVFGCRTAEEILYPGLFESLEVQTIYAISAPSPNWTGFRGRVTDYLKQLPNDWCWHTTDFYICGNAPMVMDVVKLLKGGHGVADASIYKEVFFEKRAKTRLPENATPTAVAIGDTDEEPTDSGSQAA